MASFYLLVKWINENCVYNVVSSDTIISSENVLHDPRYLIGTAMYFFRKNYAEPGLAEVLMTGVSKTILLLECKRLDKDAMNLSWLFKNGDQIEELRKKGASCTSSSIRSPKSKMHVVNIKPEILSEDIAAAAPPLIIPGRNSECENRDQKIAELEKKIVGLEKKCKKYEEMSKTTVNIVPNSPAQLETGKSMTDIGYGVLIDSMTLNSLQAHTNSPTVFARRLLKCLFSEEELDTHSVTATQRKVDVYGVPLPALDKNKIAAIIDFSTDKYAATYDQRIRSSIRKKILASLQSLHAESRRYRNAS